MIVTGRQVPWTSLRVVRFWDLAATKPSKDNKDPDWTAGCLIGFDGESRRYYVLDVKRIRETPAAVEDFIYGVHLMDDEWADRAVPIWVEEEGGSGGKWTISSMARGRFSGLDFHGRKPKENKRDRFKPFAVQAEHGNVDVVRGSWNDEWFEELESFPDGEHDDQADATSGGFIKVRPVLASGVAPMQMQDGQWVTEEQAAVRDLAPQRPGAIPFGML